MILLKNKQNTNGVSAQYPYGDMRDKTAGQNGTKADSLFMNDMVQFFEKMFAESGVTPNNLPDDATNGFQLYEAVKRVAKGYKVYSATYSYQGSPDRLEVNVLHQDDLGIGNITLAKLTNGYYQFNFGSVHPLNGPVSVIGNWRCENGFAVWSSIDHSSPTNYDLVVRTSILGSSESTVSIGDVFIEVRFYDV